MCRQMEESGLMTRMKKKIDDINLYVTQSSDINIMNSILSAYQSMSNAKVNWIILWGLKMNDCDVELNCKLGISWNTK